MKRLLDNLTKAVLVVAILSIIRLVTYCIEDKVEAAPVTTFGLGSPPTGTIDCGPVEDGGPQCCTGGTGSLPSQCNCELDLEMSSGTLDAGIVKPVPSWDPQGSNYSGGGGTNPHGYCMTSTMVADGVPCDDGGECLSLSMQAGDAATLCPTTGWDASNYLAVNGMTYPDETIVVGYVQIDVPIYPPYTIEVRSISPPVLRGHWSIAMSLYNADVPGQMNCELPNLVAASWAANTTCAFQGWSTSGQPYFEVDVAENVASGFDTGFGFHVAGCTANSYGEFYFSPAALHTYDFRMGSAGQGQFFVDGEFYFAFTSPYYPCADGGVLPTSTPVFLAFGTTPNATSGLCEAGPVCPSTQLTDYVRVTSP